MQQRNKVLAVVSIATFVASLDLFIVNVAFPSIQADFGGASDATLSWILNAYAIVFAALLVPFGRLADMVGRRRVFLTGLAVFLAGSALCAAAPSVGFLIAARVVQAMGGAALLPTSLALLLPEFPPEKRAPAVAMWSASGAVAAAAGPPVGGLLVQLSWHWVFLVNIPIGLVVGTIAARVLRESREPGPHALPDLIGALMLTLGIASLTAAIVEGPDWGWGSTRVIGLAAAALLLLAGFVRRSARHPVPVIELSLLEVRSFAAANVSSFLFFTAFGSMLLASVLFLTRVWGEDILTAGLQIAPGPLTAALFSVPAGLLSARFGQRAVALPGALVFALGGVWWIANVGTTPDYAADFLPGMIIGGAGVGLVIPSLASAAAASLPAARFATGSAVFGMSRQIGSAMGIAILIAVLGNPASDEAVVAFQRGWYVMLGASLAAAVAAAFIGRIRVPRTATEPSEEPIPGSLGGAVA